MARTVAASAYGNLAILVRASNSGQDSTLEAITCWTRTRFAQGPIRGTVHVHVHTVIYDSHRIYCRRVVFVGSWSYGRCWCLLSLVPCPLVWWLQVQVVAGGCRCLSLNPYLLTITITASAISQTAVGALTPWSWSSRPHASCPVLALVNSTALPISISICICAVLCCAWLVHSFPPHHPSGHLRIELHLSLSLSSLLSPLSSSTARACVVWDTPSFILSAPITRTVEHDSDHQYSPLIPSYPPSHPPFCTPHPSFGPLQALSCR